MWSTTLCDLTIPRYCFSASIIQWRPPTCRPCHSETWWKLLSQIIAKIILVTHDTSNQQVAREQTSLYFYRHQMENWNERVSKKKRREKRNAVAARWCWLYCRRARQTIPDSALPTRTHQILFFFPRGFFLPAIFPKKSTRVLRVQMCNRVITWMSEHFRRSVFCLFSSKKEGTACSAAAPL